MAYTTIDKSGDYFNTVLNTGDNTSPKSITGVGFQPDLVWTKTRGNTNNHTLFDSVRGAGASKELSSDSTAGEGGVDTASYGYLSSFDSDGFTATSGSIGINYYNATSSNYVNWNWLGGGTASSNTDGDITSSVSANTTSGFSIVSYTGTGTNSDTVGHGLGTTPSMIIAKGLDVREWYVQHKAISSGTLILNTSDAVSTSFPSGWINESPTSSTFSFTAGGGGTTNNVNNSGTNFIAYCFAEKEGFSKFGSYTGNGSADGSFIYLGFKPAFIIFKRTDSAAHWYLFDNKRNTYNALDKRLYPSTTGAEATVAGGEIDFVSNGVKIRRTETDINASGGSYIYMAFAEAPIVGSNNVPANAR